MTAMFCRCILQCVFFKLFCVLIQMSMHTHAFMCISAQPQTLIYSISDLKHTLRKYMTADTYNCVRQILRCCVPKLVTLQFVMQHMQVLRSQCCQSPLVDIIANYFFLSDQQFEAHRGLLMLSNICKSWAFEYLCIVFFWLYVQQTTNNRED